MKYRIRTKVTILFAQTKVGPSEEEPLKMVIIPCVVCAQNLFSIVFLTERGGALDHVTLDFAT